MAGRHKELFSRSWRWDLEKRRGIKSRGPFNLMQIGKKELLKKWKSAGAGIKLSSASPSSSCRNGGKPHRPIFVWLGLFLSSLSSPECEPTSGVKRPENWDKKVHVERCSGRPGPVVPDAALSFLCLGKEIYGDNDLPVLLLCRNSRNGAGSQRQPQELKPSASVAQLDSLASSSNRISGHLD